MPIHIESRPDRAITPGPCVAIADAQVDARLMLEHLVRSTGRVEVHSFANGQELLTWASVHAPAAVLLDIPLPGADGYRVCRELRRQGFAGSVWFVTARCCGIDLDQARQVGADGVLCKPIDPDELVHRLQRLLGLAPELDPPAQPQRGFFVAGTAGACVVN